MTLKVERGAPAELGRPIVRVHGMLADQERQVVTTGANEHVTHLMSSYIATGGPPCNAIMLCAELLWSMWSEVYLITCDVEAVWQCSGIRKPSGR